MAVCDWQKQKPEKEISKRRFFKLFKLLFKTQGVQEKSICVIVRTNRKEVSVYRNSGFRNSVASLKNKLNSILLPSIAHCIFTTIVQLP